jgi:radical SAM-linked protein
MSSQRIRVRFRKGDRVRYISHLDVLRFWERAIRRAELPLSYSQGFTPHPKLAFASPLPVGFTAEREVMDVTLDERVPIDEFARRLRVESTEDLAVVAVEEVALNAPPPQAAMLWADYSMAMPGLQPAEAEAAIQQFNQRETIPWREERGERIREYDLRTATAWLRWRPADGGVVLSMRMQADQLLTARPEAIAAALFPGQECGPIIRDGIVLDERSQARELWRRYGQYQ